MSALNSNNPNGGGKGDSSISRIVPPKVSVTSPDQQPQTKALPGQSFLNGSPAGSEAKPSPHADGFDYS